MSINHIKDILMIENVKNEDLALDLRRLVNGIDSFKEEVNIYCDLMKQMFLSESKNN